MTETFNFDFFQIPHVGVEESELTAEATARTDTTVPIRRPLDMKLSNFGAMQVGSRLDTDYTRTDTMAFKAAGESYDVNVIAEDTGIGQNVGLRGVSVNHNPLLVGSSIKYTRDDQFIRMTMDKNTGTTLAATSVEPPKFDVMDTNLVTAAGMNAASNSATKNWPSEGWRSFGGKYDFLPYAGGVLK